MNFDLFDSLSSLQIANSMGIPIDPYFKIGGDIFGSDLDLNCGLPLSLSNDAATLPMFETTSFPSPSSSSSAAININVEAEPFGSGRTGRHSLSIEVEPPAKKPVPPIYITKLTTSVAKYQCRICLEKFDSKNRFKYHETCIQHVKLSICKICSQVFIRKSHYKKHVSTHGGSGNGNRNKISVKK